MVELTLNFTTKGSYVSEITDELDLELIPIGDVKEGFSLVQRHGLEHDLSLGSVVTVGESEEVDGGCKPGIKIIRFATPGSCFHPGRFQTNRLNMLETRRMMEEEEEEEDEKMVGGLPGQSWF